MEPSYFLLALCVLLAVAAITDLRNYIIPDWISLVIVAVFLIRTIVAPPSLRLLSFDLLGTSVVFAIGLVLFAKGWFGGGDLKLLCSTILWVGVANMPRFLLAMTLAGGILALMILIIRWARSSDGRLTDHRIPYGVAIACAGFDYCLQQLNLNFW